MEQSLTEWQNDCFFILLLLYFEILSFSSCFKCSIFSSTKVELFTDGQPDKYSDWHFNDRTFGWTNGLTDEWTDRWTDVRTDGRTNGQTDGRIDGQTEEQTGWGCGEEAIKFGGLHSISKTGKVPEKEMGSGFSSFIFLWSRIFLAILLISLTSPLWPFFL